MITDLVPFEIREGTTPDGGVRLELSVEGSVVAHATANASVLDDMHSLLGSTRMSVIEHLRDALRDLMRSQWQLVEVDQIIEDPNQRLKFYGRFTHRLRDELSTGLVWYDVRSSMTGPEDVPAVVRNKMRAEVHRKLTEDGSAARALVDLHK